jgi:hypothetical protein
MNGVQRNGDDGAKVLRHDALGGLQLGIGLSEILGDYAAVLRQGLAQSGLAGGDSFRRQRQAATASGEACAKPSGRIRLEQKASVGIRHRDGVIDHAPKHRVQWELGMKQRSGCEQQIQFAEPSGKRFGASDASDAAEDILNRRAGFGGAKDDLVRLLDTKSNYVAIFQKAPIDLLSVHIEAAAVPAILETVFSMLGQDGGALPGDASIGKLQLISGFTAAKQKWRSRDGNKTAGSIRRNHLENGFPGGWV